MRRLRATVLLGALALPAATIAPQASIATSGAPRLPVGSSIIDLAVRIFDKADGLQSPTVYAVYLDLTERLWIGTENGPMRFDGDRWQLQPLPAEADQRQTRAILQSRDSTFWFATRSGVIRQRGETQTLFTARDGLPNSIVYSLLETRALTGKPQVLVGTGGGVAVFDGRRFRALALPDSLQPEGLMLGESRAPDGTLELWLASSLGKVARYARGQWMVFGAAQGFVSRSAESIVPTQNDVTSRLLVPGDAGVFTFRDDGPRGARFELLPGSPRRSFRAVELKRMDGTLELWVGNLNGVTFRKTSAGWDTVNVASVQQGGRVTALSVIAGHAGGTAVYIGTYGGRLARISVGSVATLNAKPVTRHDVMAAIVPERAPNGRMALWMGTLNAGLLHLDEHGRITEYSRETHESFTQVVALGLLSSAKRSALQRDTLSELKDLWISTNAGTYRREGTRLVRRSDGMERREVRAFVRGPLPDGSLSLLAATDSGVFRWTGQKWQALAAFGYAPVLAMTSVTATHGPSLWLAMNGQLMNVTLKGVTYSPATSISADVSSRSRRSVRTLHVTAMCGMNDAEKTGRVFAGTADGGVWWRGPLTAWFPLPPSVQDLVGTQHVRRLSCLNDGRLLIGLGLGLVVADVRSRVPAEWAVRAVATQEDGLPATEITAFAPAPMDGLMWIGTTRGAGALQIDRIESSPPPLLTVRLSSAAQSRQLHDGDQLRADSSDLSIRPVLVTNHREYDTRYRVRLDRDGDAREAPDSESGGDGDSSSWTAEPRSRYRSLAAGNYTLRVWARDYAGRIVGPSVTRFRVVPPPWRTWWAIVSYAMLIVVAIYLGHRWRLQTLQNTNAQLASSERKVRISERKFRAVFDEASDAHLLLDGSRITSANAAARLLLGMSPEELPESGVAGVSDDIEPVLPLEIALVTFALAESGAVQVFQFQLTDGSTIPLSAQITEVPLDDRTLWHLVLRDLRVEQAAEAVRLRLEDQVRDAQKFQSLGTLAGGVAHDFNNLLGVIRGNIELARDTLHDGDAVAGHLDTVFDASERARDLVRQILTFSRRSNTHEECVDLARLTRHLLPMLRSMIPSSVEIVLTGADQPLLVLGDATQLQQIVLNLASNADYAMQSRGGGRLEIALDSDRKGDAVTSPDAPMVRLRVTDTGTGMPPEVLDRLFEPFFTTKPTGEGTGLGMAVLHGIVASHGGRVRATSTIGQGTTIEVLLPSIAETSIVKASVDTAILARLAVDPAAQSLLLAPDSKRLPADVHIVLVDDDPAVGRVCEMALKRMGYRVTVFVQPGSALAFVAAAPDDVDLVITDQTMPGLSGDVLALEVHRLRDDLPVIIMSGYRYVLTDERIAEIGAHSVLQKPVPLATLRDAVEAALDEHSQLARA